ncbi:MAG TPA: GlsB/YeaQ/YmgE family stress response membrane protein [Polyangiaceae bacterium]|nr:GlsB/YeaQ/YmgE family stress response membrane protein [Polyangiaceae bacterium]
MSLLLFVVFGFVVGLLARALLPGKQSMGLIMTTVLGIVGSLLGGLIGSMISGDEITRLHPGGIIGSVIGAIAVLAIVGWIGRRRTAHV